MRRTARRMGWSSWNVFAANIDEEKIMSTIDAMAELKDAGYTYVNVVSYLSIAPTRMHHPMLARACTHTPLPHGVSAFRLLCGNVVLPGLRTTTGWSRIAT